MCNVHVCVFMWYLLVMYMYYIYVLIYACNVHTVCTCMCVYVVNVPAYNVHVCEFTCIHVVPAIYDITFGYLEGEPSIVGVMDQVSCSCDISIR